MVDISFNKESILIYEHIAIAFFYDTELFVSGSFELFGV